VRDLGKELMKEMFEKNHVVYEQILKMGGLEVFISPYAGDWSRPAIAQRVALLRNLQKSGITVKQFFTSVLAWHEQKYPTVPAGDYLAQSMSVILAYML
jgi:hypothetical protein